MPRSFVRPRNGLSPLRSKRIGASEPPTSVTCLTRAIALHEIGHLVGRGRSAPRLESEANAWLWALQHSAVEPTPATKRSISKRLRGYLAWAQNRQYRKVPPRIPERDHPFWALLELA